MKNTIVIDLDGTLANIAHRRSLVTGESPDWNKFYSLVWADDVNDWCSTLMGAMKSKGYKVVIVSARRRSTFNETYQWLHRKGVPYDDLFILRKDDDHRPDTELKQNWLDAYGPEKIFFAVDDRQKVVDMWRANNIVCLQCDKWEERKNA